MITKQSIGIYFETDSDGYVMNPTEKVEIENYWQSKIDEVVAFCQSKFGERLHSVYVRGSVASGVAVVGISDLDMFALVYPVVNRPVMWEKIEDFTPQYDLDLTYATYHSGFFKHHPKLAMVIQTQSRCVFGKDLRQTLPQYRPDKSMMTNYKWLRFDLEEMIGSIQENTVTHEQIKNLMKVVIRTGFELVMIREQKYTNALPLCCESFNNYYPEKSTFMDQALTLFLEPDLDRLLQSNIISELCEWMVQQIDLSESFEEK